VSDVGESIKMGTTRKKSRTNRRRSPLRQHRASILGIIMVLFLLVAVVSVGSISLQAKNQTYKAQETELQEQIQDEEERSEEIDELEEYVGTDEYVEETAKDKLGLVHENEIIFKKK
jgi:cell division protein DivIC